MKKIIYLLALVLFSIANNYAQNIVPNSSFELYSNCPDAFSPFSNVTGWNSYKETPDYFNPCAPSGTWSGMPFNGFGYQYPANGNAYAGIGCHGSLNVKFFTLFLNGHISGKTTVLAQEFIS